MGVQPPLGDLIREEGGVLPMRYNSLEKKRKSKNKEKIHETQKRVRYVYIRKPKDEK